MTTQNYKPMPGQEEKVRLFLDDPLLATVEDSVFRQAANTACTCGVEHVAILPDTHSGYGAPIGSVVVSSDRVIPGPVGYDIGCGMALYLTNVPASALKDRNLRRDVMNAIDRGIAMGEGKTATHDVEMNKDLLGDVLNRGAHALRDRGFVPPSWVERCERPVHAIPESPDGTVKPFDLGEVPGRAQRGFSQLGTLGGGKAVAA
jgi:tRNA-splicing ligase RtcB